MGQWTQHSCFMAGPGGFDCTWACCGGGRYVSWFLQSLRESWWGGKEWEGVWVNDWWPQFYRRRLTCFLNDCKDRCLSLFHVPPLSSPFKVLASCHFLFLVSLGLLSSTNLFLMLFMLQFLFLCCFDRKLLALFSRLGLSGYWSLNSDAMIVVKIKHYTCFNTTATQMQVLGIH